MTAKRSAGILLHPSSLPGPGGIGSLGSHCRAFIEFLAASGFSHWQVLPLTPPAAGNSPYSAYSAFAGNPLLIDLEQLVEAGDLSSEHLSSTASDVQVDFSAVAAQKERLLYQASETFFSKGHTAELEEFWQFCDTTYWLHDYALFQALKRHYRGIAWHRWPKKLAMRDGEACERAAKELGHQIGTHKYQQWQFHRQWQRVRSYAAERGVTLIGDLPIFVAHDSADVWCNRHLFLLDESGRPSAVAGVPPDYFSKTGQLWGNPLYDWQRMAQDGYAWWIARIRQLLEQFDMVRIDHFRGFEAAWHVPATARTAVKGAWVPGPGEAFFNAVGAAIGSLPFIAEDLGVITPAVEALRDCFQLPGMKIMQFAFDSDAANPYLPHNHVPNSIVYTGTHDNDTTLGWAANLPAATRDRMARYLGGTGVDPAGDLIRSTLMSVARIAILPLQDLLGLSSEARMNRPGTADGNWGWRFQEGRLTEPLARQWREMLECYGRCPADAH